MSAEGAHEGLYNKDVTVADLIRMLEGFDQALPVMVGYEGTLDSLDFVEEFRMVPGPTVLVIGTV